MHSIFAIGVLAGAAFALPLADEDQDGNVAYEAEVFPELNWNAVSAPDGATRDNGYCPKLPPKHVTATVCHSQDPETDTVTTIASDPAVAGLTARQELVQHEGYYPYGYPCHRDNYPNIIAVQPEDVQISTITPTTVIKSITTATTTTSPTTTTTTNTTTTTTTSPTTTTTTSTSTTTTTTSTSVTNMGIMRRLRNEATRQNSMHLAKRDAQPRMPKARKRPPKSYLAYAIFGEEYLPYIPGAVRFVLGG
ncbi:hypothetical protein BDZ91DRAFT_753773 [Kalaharituber pfeilii]|nr:hypothetical protein BDZ91DRAFT_753773 [Kalaharituber pfeilii]